MKLPNMLTLIRIGISPLFILFFLINSTWSLIVCILLVGAIELTDFLDGQIARRYEQITDFGRLMDPFADSIARFTIFLCFLSAGLAPVWLIAIFFYRDVLVSVVRIFSMREGVVVSARRSGKTKAWVQALCIFLVLFVLLAEKVSLLPDALSRLPLETAFIFIAAVITAWSAVDYWASNRSVVINALNSRTSSRTS